MVTLVYSVDSGTGRVVGPDDIGVGVDDVTTVEDVEDPVAKVAFR